MKHYLNTNKQFGKFILLNFLLLFFFQCNSSEDKGLNALVDEDNIIENQQLNNVVYSVPAPSEMAGLLIDNPNLVFNPEFMNPLNKHEQYTTNEKLAVNLGVYIADLSFASYFEQNQVSKEYYNMTHKISEELGISNAVNEKQANSIVEGKLNKEQLIRIINETFMNTDAYLQENKRHDIMAMILAGGWIEAQYIAVSYTECEVNKYADLTQSILDQSISIDIMKRMFDQTKSNINLDKFKDDFSKIEVSYKKMGTSPSPVDFKEFCELIKTIRKAYTN